MSPFLKRLLGRQKAHALLSLWYHPAYEVPALARTARVRSLIVDRAKRILSHLVEEKIISAKDINPSPRAGLSDLALIHSEGYLDSVSDPKILGRIFGLEPHDVNIDELLQAQRRAVGGTCSAIQDILDHPEKIGFNLGGGFHHAGPEQGGGFCVYNDVAIGIAKSRQKGFEDPVAIVDLDFHQGDGNDIIFAEDPSVAVYSLHGSVWTHLQVENEFNIHLPETTDDEKYIKTLRKTFPKFFEKHPPRLMVYIAGTDVLAGDPLGCFKMSLEGVLERDQFIIHWAKKHKVALVITLSGGYSLDACRATLNLISSLFDQEISKEHKIEEDLQTKFAEIAKTLSPEELQREKEEHLKFSEADILADLAHGKKHRRILDFYSAYGIELALKRFGILKKIKDLGYTDLKITVDPSDPSHQMIRGEARPKDKPGAKRVLLVEIVLHKEHIRLPGSKPEDPSLNLLSVEWLLMQDPLKDFSVTNPPFPDQKHPGLGISPEIKELLSLVCHRVKLDGVLFRPSHYHVAVGSGPGYHFLNPKDEGRFQAFQEVLKDQALFEAAKWVTANRMVLDDGKEVPWCPTEFIHPETKALKEYFDSREYREAVLEEKFRLLEFGLHVKK